MHYFLDYAYGFNGNIICPEQRLSIQDALKTYTIWAAKHMFMEDKLGSIEVGKYADIVMWDKNIYTTPIHSLRDIKPKMTIMNGKIVYNKNT